MAPFDIPHVTHDMMLRFMGVNFTGLIDGTAKIPSAIGTDAKPVFAEDHEAKPGAPASVKTPQQNKAMWEGLPFSHFDFVCLLIDNSLLQRWLSYSGACHCLRSDWYRCMVSVETEEGTAS